MRRFRAIFAVLPLLAGCTNLTTRVAPGIDLSKETHIYVRHLLTDGRGLDEMIARELRRRGYDAVAGTEQQMPDNAQLVVVYQDEWTFDFTNYMIRLNVAVRTARTDNLLATGGYFDPSVTGHQPIVMVDKVLDQLFKVRGPAVPEPPPALGPESTSPSTN